MCGIIERIMRKTLWAWILLLGAAAHPDWGLDDPIASAMKATEKTDYDLPPLRDRSRSLIRWDDPEAALDIRRWINERDLRDREPGWKVRQRLAAEPEGVGKIISCIGDCRIYRGLFSSRARWLSRVAEGDEIHTGVNSYVWMALIDGTLVRVAPESSVSMLEVNITPTEVFFQARLNQGYLHWQPRTGRPLKPMTAPETDPLFLPLMDREANLEWFQRSIYRDQPDRQQISLTTSPDLLGYNHQQFALKTLTVANNAFMSARSHRSMLVCPNGTLMLNNVAASLFYGPTNKSYFKVSTFNDDQEGEMPHPQRVEFFYRGYSNDKAESVAVTGEEWFAISEDGRSMASLASVPPDLAVSELMTKRIPTFMLVRERWLARAKAFWDDAAKPDLLAINWGYRLWGRELEERVTFLKEYTRRIETTGLRSIERLAKETRREGDPVMGEFDARYFSRALDHYYLTFKRRHNHSKESVRDMSDLHYYGWMLRNARQQ
jgi:hypothetical protein